MKNTTDEIQQLLAEDRMRLKPVKSILVTQPSPEDPKSPYKLLSEKYSIQIDFRPFIDVMPVSLRDFRRQRINILDYTAVIFTSRHAVTNFFTICKELKIEVPSDMKYFCVSEQTSNYLQKYIVIRKRKIFTGEKTAQDVIELVKKHKVERFLYPCSDVRREDIPKFLDENEYTFKEMILYKTVSSDLSDLAEVNYDIIVFYSPSGVKSLFDNFPDFKQNNTRLAAFGPTTSKAVRDANLILDIEAPLPNAPSMTGALEAYIKLVAKSQ